MKTRQGATSGVTLSLMVLALGCQGAQESKDKAVNPVEPTEKQAVQAIQELGGSTTQDWEAKGWPIVGVELRGDQVVLVQREQEECPREFSDG